MRHFWIFMVLGWWGLAASALADLPKVDLVVELRQVEEGSDGVADAGAGYRVGTQSSSPVMAQQRLVVLNGEKASLRLNQAVPMQWVQSVQAPPSGPNFSGNAGVSQSIHWFDVGHTITVTPKWPGGKKDALVEIEVQQAEMRASTRSDLPTQSRQQVTTTMTIPLAQWVTVAASGDSAPKPGRYSSEAGNEPRRLLQIRLQAR